MNSTDKTRILKFIHRCLPTNKKLNDIDSKHEIKCPRSNKRETNEHVTTCTDDRQTKIWQKIWKSLAKRLDKSYTQHTIKECILTGIKLTMTSSTTTLHHEDISFEPTGPIKRAIEEQNEIRWNNFYRGRISLEWLTAQQEQYEQQYKTKQDTEQWATSIITTLWHGFLELWEAQKDDQHGQDKIEQHEKERTILLRRTRYIYANMEQWDHEDMQYFKEPVHYWENTTNKKIKDWLNMAEKLTETSKERATKKARRRQPPITNFFNRNNNLEPQERRGKIYKRRPPRKPPHKN
jgi:hypothetical protein